ncbi:MAG: cobalamin-binding protein [Acidobacteria bacterium]|nr:MAG: cobalamin-binding protein [Acidobacteriota bacterium]
MPLRDFRGKGRLGRPSEWNLNTDYPSRIVCLTEETTEVLYRIGAGDLVVGVSGYTVRPPEARRKPRVSAFIQANFEKILRLNPDLVLGFSDLQADIAKDLIRRGLWVVTFNQRSVEEIYRMVRVLGGMVGRAEAAQTLVQELQEGVEKVREKGEALLRRPRVFFEEWPDPLISGIRWVSELIEVAGGEDVFPELRRHGEARGRIVAAAEVVRRAPEVIIGSWCGRKVRFDTIRGRPGWDQIPAVRRGKLYEIKSALILQPGPAALTDGLAKLHEIIAEASLG